MFAGLAEVGLHILREKGENTYADYFRTWHTACSVEFRGAFRIGALEPGAPVNNNPVRGTRPALCPF